MTALLHHTSSTNLCILLSPSIAFPKLMNGAPVHSGRLVVSESANLCLSPPFLSQWRRLPFLRTIFEVVLTIWSQSSEYEFNVILAPQWTSSSFPGANASEEMESSTPQGRWGEFTLTRSFGRGNIEEKSGERLGYRECSARNPCNSTVTLLSLH